MVVTCLELIDGKALEKNTNFKRQVLLVFGEIYFIYQYEYIVFIFTVVLNRLTNNLMYMWK